MRKLFITGIDTGIGKTIASGILTEALEADYWKPVQAGDLDNTDSMKVKAMLSNQNSKVHPEGLRLKYPMSPHAAAEKEGLEISEDDFSIPSSTKENIIIEGAGGLMVPLNNKFLIVDLIQKLKAEVVLVSKNYLGSINHTILTASVLKNKGIPVLGIIFNGEEVPSTEKVILEYTGFEMLGRINIEKEWNKNTVLKYKKTFSEL